LGLRLCRACDARSEPISPYCFIGLTSPQLALALLPFLISPACQPQGFLISQFPIAASFANPVAFVPIPAGPLGGEHLVRASRLGGLGGESIDKPDGKWCGYWHEQGGAIETLARGGRAIEENGELSKITLDQRGFLGEYAGSSAPPPSALAATMNTAPTGLINISSVAMQPIKVGVEEATASASSKNVLADDEESQEDRDTVLLSRSESLRFA